MLHVEQLGFRHHAQSPWIFRHHSLTLGAGEIAAIIGPNGRGKTTLIKTILGLHKANEGRIELGTQAAYVPQHSGASFPYPVRDAVVMGRARHIKTFRSPSRSDYRQADAALERLGITEFAQRPITELSGGERQLVLIARAIVSESRLIVLDEPASALDYRNQQTILQVLRSLSRDDGIAILFTTHMPQHAQVLADRVLLMKDWDQYQYGRSDEVLTETHLSALYGIDIRALAFDHQGQAHQTVVPVFA